MGRMADNQDIWLMKRLRKPMRMLNPMFPTPRVLAFGRVIKILPRT